MFELTRENGEQILLGGWFLGGGGGFQAIIIRQHYLISGSLEASV